MTLKTRVLSLVLAGSMALSIMPVSAFAADGTQTENAAAAQASTSSSMLAFDDYGYPYNSASGDESKTNHSEIEASGDGWSYKKASNGNYYILTLYAGVDPDLTGVTLNYRVDSYANLKGGTFGNQVQLLADAEDCTFNSSVVLSGEEATLTNCTLNYGLTNQATNGKLVNCNAYGDYGIVSQIYGGTKNRTLTIVNDENHVIEGSLYARKDCHIVVEGGHFTGRTVCSEDTSTIEIKNGLFETSVEPNGGTVTIQDGSFQRYIIPTGTSNIVINGGTFEMTVAAGGASAEINGGLFKGVVSAQAGTLTIKDGTFKSNVVRTTNGTGTLTITGGLFAYAPFNAEGDIYKLNAPNSTFNDMTGPVYVANSTAAPHINMVYTPEEGRKVIAWRLDMDTSPVHAWGYTDAAGDNPKIEYMLGLAKFSPSADQTNLAFDCISAFSADATLTPVLSMNASDFVFHAPTEDTQAYVTPGENMRDDLEFTYYYANALTGQKVDGYPTAPGTYQLGILVRVKDTEASDRYINRILWNTNYYQLPCNITDSSILTSSDWTFSIESPDANVPLEITEDGTPNLTGMTLLETGVYVGKNWEYNPTSKTLWVSNNSYFENFTGTVNCKVVVGEGTNIGGGNFADTVTFKGGTVSGGFFAVEPEGYTPGSLHTLTFKGEDTEFTVNSAFTTTKVYFGGNLDIRIHSDTPIYSVTKNYLPHATTSLHYTADYASNFVLNNLDEPTLHALTLNGVKDAYVMLDTTYKLDMNQTNPQDIRVGVKVTVKADECDDNTYVEWTAEGMDIPEADKNNAELTFEMPDSDVTLTATYKLRKPETGDDGTITVPDDGSEVEGDGWTAKKDDDGNVSVTVTDGSKLEGSDLNCDKITVKNTTLSGVSTGADVTLTGSSTIEGGTFKGTVSGDGTIEDGTFTGDVEISGTIEGGIFEGNVSATNIEDGIFSGNITVSGDVKGGVFAKGTLPVSSIEVTVTGGAAIKGIPDDIDTVNVVNSQKDQKLTVSFDNAEKRTFIGWQANEEGSEASAPIESNTITIAQGQANTTITPVVEMDSRDVEFTADDTLTADKVKVNLPAANASVKVTGIQYRSQKTGAISNTYPTAAGKYDVLLTLSVETLSAQNDIALYAVDPSSIITAENGVGYYVPQTLETKQTVTIQAADDGKDDDGNNDGKDDSKDDGKTDPVTPVTPSTSSDDGGAVVAAVVGGAAVGGAAYMVGTEVWFKMNLPEGASVPTNREQLAVLLWTAAGKPEPANAALFTDIAADNIESQKAARWCVEQGLMKDLGETFQPGNYTFRLQVINAWNDLQAKLSTAQ